MSAGQRAVRFAAGAVVAGATTWALTRRWTRRPPQLPTGRIHLPGRAAPEPAAPHLGERDPFSEHGHAANRDPAVDQGQQTTAWVRRNFHEEAVSLVAGPSLAIGAATGIGLAPGLDGRVRLAGIGGALAIGTVGLYDDLAGDSASKGLHGHLEALRRGTVTSGAVKVGVIGLTGLASAAAVSDNAFDAAVGGLAVAGHANLLNLLDLRPGRAGKAALLHAPLVLTGPAAAMGAATLGAVVASLPDDLGERTMLGDAGSNVLGGLLGMTMIAGEGRRARLFHLGIVTALTLASEKVSFTKVIERTPLLRELDHLGRRT